MRDSKTEIVVKEVIIKNEQGLHARPAAIFVQRANTFDSIITIRKDDQIVDGKSIMGIMMLAASKGNRIVIEARGEDAEQAVGELEKIVSGDEIS